MVAPVRDLFVHVGLPKTGTTYLQETLFGSTEALARHGVDMVPRSRRDNYWLMLALRDHVDPTADPPAIVRAVDDFAARARRDRRCRARSSPTSGWRRSASSRSSASPTPPARRACTW